MTVMQNAPPPVNSKGTIIVAGDWRGSVYCGTTWWRNKYGITFALFNWLIDQTRVPSIAPFKHDARFEFTVYLEAIKITLEQVYREFYNENPGTV